MSYSEEAERAAYERRYEEQAYEERRREDVELQNYYEHFFSLDGWIDRMYDEFMKKYGNS
jgi:hypothetical protein